LALGKLKFKFELDLKREYKKTKEIPALGPNFACLGPKPDSILRSPTALAPGHCQTDPACQPNRVRACVFPGKLTRGAHWSVNRARGPFGLCRLHVGPCGQPRLHQIATDPRVLESGANFASDRPPLAWTSSSPGTIKVVRRGPSRPSEPLHHRKKRRPITGSLRGGKPPGDSLVIVVARARARIWETTLRDAKHCRGNLEHSR
jgi:hypothetical protein